MQIHFKFHLGHKSTENLIWPLSTSYEDELKAERPLCCLRLSQGGKTPKLHTISHMINHIWTRGNKEYQTWREKESVRAKWCIQPQISIPFLESCESVYFIWQMCTATTEEQTCGWQGWEIIVLALQCHHQNMSTLKCVIKF